MDRFYQCQYCDIIIDNKDYFEHHQSICFLSPENYNTQDQPIREETISPVGCIFSIEDKSERETINLIEQFNLIEQTTPEGVAPETGKRGTS